MATPNPLQEAIYDDQARGWGVAAELAQSPVHARDALAAWEYWKSRYLQTHGLEVIPEEEEPEPAAVEEVPVPEGDQIPPTPLDDEEQPAKPSKSVQRRLQVVGD